MANLKSLAKDTAIYGLSSIAGRFINYLLVPIQTTAFVASGGQYGVVTNIYAYTALLLVILTYGMETTFFRYVNKTEENPQTVYSTVLISVGATAALFVALVFSFLPQIATFMKYPDHQSWVAVMFVCVAIDAFKCIPFAYLRYKKKAIKFAARQLSVLSRLMMVISRLARRSRSLMSTRIALALTRTSLFGKLSQTASTTFRSAMLRCRPAPTCRHLGLRVPTSRSQPVSSQVVNGTGSTWR